MKGPIGVAFLTMISVLLVRPACTSKTNKNNPHERHRLWHSLPLCSFEPCWVLPCRFGPAITRYPVCQTRWCHSSKQAFWLLVWSLSISGVIVKIRQCPRTAFGPPLRLGYRNDEMMRLPSSHPIVCTSTRIYEAQHPRLPSVSPWCEPLSKLKLGFGLWTNPAVERSSNKSKNESQCSLRTTRGGSRNRVSSKRSNVNVVDLPLQLLLKRTRFQVSGTPDSRFLPVVNHILHVRMYTGCSMQQQQHVTPPNSRPPPCGKRYTHTKIYMLALH